MEKYGAEKSEYTYQILVPKPGKENEFQVIGRQLPLPEATKIVNSTPDAIIRPEKDSENQ